MTQLAPAPDAPSPAEPSLTAARAAKEIAAAFAFATALAALLYRVPALSRYYSAIVAALLLYVPSWVLRRRELADYGLTTRPLGRGFALAGQSMALFFPPFFGLYLMWQQIACAIPGLQPLALGVCGQSLLAAFTPRLPPDLLELAAGQLIVVALPEEFFFRGYVQGRLAEVWRGPRVLDVPIGPLVVAAALFAACHVIVQGSFVPLAVFFPGLVFGVLRARSGSILAGTLFHAACNLYIEILNRSFLGG